MIVDANTSEIEKLLRDLLDQRFKDEFEFGPIVFKPRIDEDGQGYLQSYIVFNGDQTKLDPTWTVRLPRLLWDRAEQLGYPGIPDPLFVELSEWPELEKSLE